MQSGPIMESSTDLVFTLLIATAAIFYGSRHLYRKGEMPEFFESMLTHRTKTVVVILLICVGVLVFFGLFSIIYALGNSGAAT